MKKQFKILVKAWHTNKEGLYRMIVVAQDGETFRTFAPPEVCESGVVTMTGNSFGEGFKDTIRLKKRNQLTTKNIWK